MAYTAVLFDIGGVLVRTDDPAPRTALAARFGLTRAQLDALVFGSEAAHACEMGTASILDVWEHARRSLGFAPGDLPDFQARFWAGDRLDRDLWGFMAGLRPRLRTGLLTNSWWSDPFDFLSELYGLSRRECAATVDAAISSNREGVRKPDARIFQVALEQLGTAPAETIFVDDFPANIAAAQALGLRGVLFTAPGPARAEISALLGL